MSSNLGDLILDHFRGCATALVTSDRVQRQWVGIDLSELAIKLVNDRIADDRGPLSRSVKALKDPPVRADMQNLPKPTDTACMASRKLSAQVVRPISHFALWMSITCSRAPGAGRMLLRTSSSSARAATAARCLDDDRMAVA
ncbi:MAG: hypothetical protein OXD29_07010 [Roseovarius sp.]|nr:hypothetical protein [Roseovarius sp.]